MKALVRFTIDEVDYIVDGEFDTFTVQSDAHYDKNGSQTYNEQQIELVFKPDPKVTSKPIDSKGS